MDSELTKTHGDANDGNDAIGEPLYQFVLGGEWDLLWLSSVFTTGRVICTGSQYVDEANDLKASGWTHLELGVCYDMRLPKKQYRLAYQCGKHITTENYWVSASDSYLTQGDPCSQLSMTVDF